MFLQIFPPRKVFITFSVLYYFNRGLGLSLSLRRLSKTLTFIVTKVDCSVVLDQKRYSGFSVILSTKVLISNHFSLFLGVKDKEGKLTFVFNFQFQSRQIRFPLINLQFPCSCSSSSTLPLKWFSHLLDFRLSLQKIRNLTKKALPGNSLKEDLLRKRRGISPSHFGNL